MRRAHRFSAPRRIKEAAWRRYNNNAAANINRAMSATVMYNAPDGRANAPVEVPLVLVLHQCAHGRA